MKSWRPCPDPLLYITNVLAGFGTNVEDLPADVAKETLNFHDPHEIL